MWHNESVCPKCKSNKTSLSSITEANMLRSNEKEDKTSLHCKIVYFLLLFCMLYPTLKAVKTYSNWVAQHSSSTSQGHISSVCFTEQIPLQRCHPLVEMVRKPQRRDCLANWEERIGTGNNLISIRIHKVSIFSYGSTELATLCIQSFVRIEVCCCLI